MTEPRQVAERYLDTWNASSSERKRSLEAWSLHASYADPMMHAEGREEIGMMIDHAVEKFAGHQFSLAGEPDGHGSFLRFSWELAPQGGGAPVARGTDIVHLDDEGRISKVVGFLDGASS